MSFECFVAQFWIFVALLGVKGGLEMIGSHRAPSSLNVSPYRAIWTHFRPIFMIFIDLIPQLEKAAGIWDMPTLDSPQIHDRSTTDSREMHHN